MANAVRLEKRSEVVNTTSLIFDCLFPCIVPYHATRSIEEMRVRGLHHSGVREIDSRFHKQRTRVMLSIADMVGKYREGIAVAVVEPNDVPKIYEYVQKHLFAWTDYMESAAVNMKPPLDDLIALDQFADSLFNYVKYEPKKTAMQDFFDKYKGKRASFNKDQLFDPEKLRKFLENDPAKIAQRQHDAIYGRGNMDDNGDGVVVSGKGSARDLSTGSKLEIQERDSFNDFFQTRRQESFRR